MRDLDTTKNVVLKPRNLLQFPCDFVKTMLATQLYRQWRDRALGPRQVILAEAAEPYGHPSTSLRASLPITERLVQAIWYDQRLRAEALRASDGRAVKILAPGFWNLEAGPDFRRALIQFDEEKPTLTDVEIHLSAADWQRHGHDRDPLYNNVGLHVVLWDDGAKANSIPLLVLQHSLAAPLEELCDAIDPEAYPYSDALHTGRCAQTLLRLPADSRDALLEAAGDERLLQKAQKISRWAEHDGWEQALYEGLAEALGYKANKQPMRLLTQRLPLANLSREPLAREAALLGAAGFLPKTSDRHWDAASRHRAKRLWELWWKMREERKGETINPKLWKFSGLRPQNFPQRRLAAMSLLLTKHPQLADDLRALVASGLEPKKTIAALEEIFASVDDPFWSRHYHFGAPAREVVALIGRPRARDIIVNVVLPFVVAHAQATRSAALEQNALALYEIFPRLASHSVETFAVYRFFGPDAAAAKILAGARRQQGLLQLFRDFCLNDSSACARCPLPELMSHWPKQA